MGLFSFFKKNKQDRAAEDSGRFYSKDDDAAVGERARAKRASNAGGGASRRPGNDPLLPEKKRARRRLVGAVALALAAAVGLPMLLDSGPKPGSADIAIQVPSKEKAAPLPLPDKAVAAEDSVDQGEEVVAATAAENPKPAKPAAAPAAAPEREIARVDLRKPEPKETARPEHKEKDQADARLAERERLERIRADRERIEKERADRAERLEKERADKAERLAKQKAEEKQKAEQRAEQKAAAKPADSARALAILEDKSKTERDHDKADAGQKFVLQVAAMSSAEKAAEVQAKLREAGISSWTQKTSTSSGELIRVRIGPLNRDDAEKVRAKLKGIGMSGAMTPV
jgi:DedD protein